MRKFSTNMTIKMDVCNKNGNIKDDVYQGGVAAWQLDVHDGRGGGGGWRGQSGLLLRLHSLNAYDAVALVHFRSPVLWFILLLVAMNRDSITFRCCLGSPCLTMDACSQLGKCPLLSMWFTMALESRWCLTSALCSLILLGSPL